jgi:hypothetical protein
MASSERTSRIVFMVEFTDKPIVNDWTLACNTAFVKKTYAQEWIRQQKFYSKGLAGYANQKYRIEKYELRKVKP